MIFSVVDDVLMRNEPLQRRLAAASGARWRAFGFIVAEADLQRMK